MGRILQVVDLDKTREGDLERDDLGFEGLQGQKADLMAESQKSRDLPAH